MLTDDDLRKIRAEVDESVSTQLKPIKKDTKKLRKDLNMVLKYLDGERAF